MKYRGDIQIVRGVAVLLVVLYHLGVQSIQSGFLGVDIFFVVSGFLMAGLYDKDKKYEFIMKRARRLLPAYFTVIFATLILSLFIATPNETQQVVQQALYATVFASNIGFWMQNTYFSNTEFSPLLHLWSLGVEIQFYVIVPIIAALFARARGLLFLTFLLSLILCFIVVGISPKTSFFMMPLRLWEFLIGFACAYYFCKEGGARFSHKPWLGFAAFLVLIFIPFMKVDGTSLSVFTGHPGVFSLLVSVATAILLIFGLPKAVEKSLFGSVFIKLGNYSYSIYLVHFPILVLYLTEPFSGTITQASSWLDTAIMLVLIILSSLLMYHLVEKGVRTHSIARLIAAPVISIAGLALLLPYLQYSNLPLKEQQIFNAFSDRSTYRCGKLIRIIEPKAISCELTDNSSVSKKRLLLVGNSHADSIKTAFATSAIREQVSLFFVVSNNSLLKGGLSPQRIVNEAAARSIDTIVLHFSDEAIDTKKVQEVVSLANDEEINVVFIAPVPAWSEHIPKAMYDHLRNKADLPQKSRNMYLAQNKAVIDDINNINLDNFRSVSVVEYFCDPLCSYSSSDGTPYYFDKHHLTLTGSNILSPLFSQIIREL